jgi:signal peptidase I
VGRPASGPLTLDNGVGVDVVKSGLHSGGPLSSKTTGVPSRTNQGRAGHASRFITALLLSAGLAILAAGISFRLAGLHLQTVLSGSMRPTMSPGDLAVTQSVPIGSLRVGDVIVFIPPHETQPVIHRIASRQGDVITTKGDANGVADPWHVRLQGATGNRLVFVVPFLGWLPELQRPALLLAGLLMGLAILLELRKEVTARTKRSRPEPQS